MGRLRRSYRHRRFTADASLSEAPLRAAWRVDAPVPRGVPATADARGGAGDQPLTELVDTLLTLARVDEGRVPLHREPVDLGEIVEETRETGELLAEPAGLTLDVQVPPEPIVAPVDRSRIRQLLLNLLTNAVKYTPPGGRVRVRSTRRRGGPCSMWRTPASASRRGTSR
jgi:signal transduction histidine kinase